VLSAERSDVGEQRVVQRFAFGREARPRRQYVREREQIDRLIYEEIRERRSQPDGSRSDILSLLISAHDENGEALTDVELRDDSGP
jgi:unspecific monooxygenase